MEAKVESFPKRKSLRKILQFLQLAFFVLLSPETLSISPIYLVINVHQKIEYCISEGDKNSKKPSYYTHDVSVHGSDTLNRSIQNCPAFYLNLPHHASMR